MITPGLTEKQSKLFNYILGYAKEHGSFPSYQTIIEDTWISSKNGVHQYLKVLYSKKYLISTDWGDYELHPSKKHFVNSPENPIPVKGVITAGVMQEAVESDLGSLSVRDLFPKAKSPYCVRVSGSSMEEIGIKDGDLVILDDSELQSGDIGAILYDGETTLKEVHIGNNEVVLTPKSKNHSPIVIAPDEFEEVKVLGRYVAHFNNGRIKYID
ncbi:LexA family protein [Halalkalibaculum sp. DA3122]|uniref:LexA family protein n=1 Tax=Halalkalibaculum sp. DA3122 TaxID=3373607 RepID=UPI003754FA13